MHGYNVVEALDMFLILQALINVQTLINLVVNNNVFSAQTSDCINRLQP